MPNGQHDPSAVELAHEALAGGINNALSFTYQLIEIIQDRVKYTKRHTGQAWPASRTLRERIGSCRDLAMLMVEACRSIGIPSRFVSGYHFEDPLPPLSWIYTLGLNYIFQVLVGEVLIQAEKD